MKIKKINIILASTLLIIIMKTFLVNPYWVYTAVAQLNDSPESIVIISSSIDLKNNNTLSIDPSITLYPISTIIIYFTCTANDIESISLYCPYGYNETFSACPPYIDIPFNSFNVTRISFDLYFNNTIPTHLPAFITLSGNYGILTVEKVVAKPFNSLKSDEQSKGEWKLLKQKIRIWDLAMSQTWSKLRMQIPLVAVSKVVLESYKQPMLKFNWSYSAKSKITLDSSEIYYSSQEKIKIKQNEILNYYHSSYSFLKLIFRQTYAFEKVHIEITLNIWYKESQDNISLFDLDNIPFLPPWLSIPLGIIIMVIPMAGVSKRVYSEKDREMDIKTKNVE